MEVGTYGQSYGLGINVDLSKPRSALVATRLDARIVERESGKVLWEGYATIATREGDDKWPDGMIATKLAGALFDGFPRPTRSLPSAEPRRAKYAPRAPPGNRTPGKGLLGNERATPGRWKSPQRLERTDAHNRTHPLVAVLRRHRRPPRHRAVTVGLRGACRPGRVTRFHAPDTTPLGRGTISVEPAPGQADSLEFRTYAGAVARELTRVGYVEPLAGAPASQQVALLTVERETFRPQRDRGPVSVGVVAARRAATGRAWAWEWASTSPARPRSRSVRGSSSPSANAPPRPPPPRCGRDAQPSS
uniref:hypothetical protein n=1 Tax=Paenibacillus abyssi TaxID=1340531 RepID=UPI00366A783F